MDKRYRIVFLAALAVLILDQFTKHLLFHRIKIGESVAVIENVFHITFVTNTGSAFGLFKGINWFFILLSLAVIIAIIHYIRKADKKRKLVLYSLGLLLGGTLGNLTDRIIHGFVVDFLDFRIWPVFNIADSAITVGAIMLFFLLWND